MGEAIIEEVVKLTEKKVNYSSTLSAMKNNRDAKKLLKLYSYNIKTLMKIVNKRKR